MESKSSQSPLIAIVGPTASGKSALAMKLAKEYDGEIICADSRTVYKGMDIGTAKPTADDKRRVPHHLLDIINPDEDFNVSDFKELAEKAIKDISLKNRIPFLVGGSGLYIDAVLFDYGFSGPGEVRNPSNPRHLSKDAPQKRSELRKHTLIIGLNVPRAILKKRIMTRVEKMTTNGFIEEVKTIRQAYPNSKALLAPGYKAFNEYLQGSLSLEEAKTLFTKNDFQLAKRQMTWFKRNKNIVWVQNFKDTDKLVKEFLSKFDTIVP